MKDEKISKGKLSVVALFAIIMLIAICCALSNFGEKRTVVYAEEENTVYFDPVNGVDTGTGLDALNGVKTFEKAKELAKSNSPAIIMLISTWTITATENMTVDAGGLTIKRGYTDIAKTQPFTGTMISVASSNFVVSFSNITLDGGAIFTYNGEVIDEIDKDTQTNRSLYGNNGISVLKSNTASMVSNDSGHLLYVGGDTIIGTGVKLTKNYMTADNSYGTAVYVDNGIKFTMNDGSSIENNIAKCSNYIHGVAVYTKGKFDMNGGEIKKNLQSSGNSLGVINIDNQYGNTTTEFNLGSVDENGSYSGTGVISENYGGIAIGTNSSSKNVKIGIYSGSITNNCFYYSMINLNTEKAEAFLYGGNITDNVVSLSSFFPEDGYIGSIYKGTFHVKGSPNLSNNTGGGYDADFGFLANESKLIVDGPFTPIYETKRATRLSYRELGTQAVYLGSTYPRKIFIESFNNTIDVDIPNEFVMNYTNATTKTTEKMIFVQDDATNFGKDTLYLHSTQYYSVTYYDKTETDYTSCSASIQSNKMYYAKDTALALPTSSEITRTGGTFLGWTATNDASDTTYITEISATDIGDKAYYANWKFDEYNINYELNGGIGATDTTYTIESKTIILPIADVMSKTDYTFDGWYNNAEFSGSAVTEIPQGSTGNKTFYAKWKLAEYDIIYNLNGGSGATDTTYTIESETIILPTSDVMSKTDYIFDGWYDNAEFSGSAVTEIPQGSSGDKTFYAKWKMDGFQIFVRSLTGENISCIVKGTDTINSLKEKLQEKTGKPVASIRFIFANKVLDDNRTLYDYNIQKEATIHMVIEKYTITFIVNGEETTNQVEYGSVPTAPTNPTKANHKFVGWDSEIESVTGDKTYTAVFVEVGTIYDIKFYQPQVWDCQRSPAFPIASHSFRISGLKTAYDENLNKLNWADGDYIKFTKVYSKVSEIPNATIKNRIINSLVSYTNCTTEEIANAIVVKETLYSSDGTVKQELSSYGLIWALGDIGFLYTALNGSLSYSGGVGTYVTFKSQNSNNISVDIPDDSKPIDEEDDNDTDYIINDTTDTSQAYVYFGGQVIDENKQELSGITVTLTYNGETYLFTTDSNGNFISDVIALAEDNTSYTIKINDGTHVNVVYTRTIDNYGYGNDLSNQVASSNEIYIYTSPTVEENGKEFTYTITFEKLGDYGTISKDTLQVAYGSIIIISRNKIVINGQEIIATANAKDLIYDYSFVKWIIGEGQANEKLVITNDLTIKAEFARTNIEYTIIFKNGDTELSKKTDCFYNGIVTAPTDTPTKASIVDKDFTFIGWKLDNSGELLTTIPNVTGDATYIAQFRESVRKYTITFVVNGEETSNQVEYGTMPTAPTNPTKASTAEYTYTFYGWDNEIVKVVSNATYTAEFISKPKKISSIVDSTNPEDEDKVNCEIESEKGLDADSVIVLKVIKKESISSDIVLTSNMEFLKTYNVKLLVNQVEITPNEELTIKFAKPVGLKDSDTYKIVLFENGETVEKIARVDGDYLVFSTSVLGDFAIVGEVENEEFINLLWLIILLSVLMGLELIAIGTLLKRNADEKNKIKNNRTYSFIGLPLLILAATFVQTQLVAIIILSIAVVALGVIIVLLSINSYKQKQNTEIYKEENVEKLKQVIDNAKLYATTKVNISKKTIADYLEKNYKDRVLVNRRENYTSTGLPLADTHYLVDKKKKECFIYVYELKDNKMFLLLKINNELSSQIAKQHKNINLSKFPKSKDSWYSLIIDDSFDNANDLFKIFDKIINSYNE